ncbi:MAG: hypothetical protein RL711_1992 [Bacteroidota bacterium]|jgi:hypothetical protein
MKKIVALTLFLVVTLVLSEGAYAQKFTKRKRYLSVGWSIGACNYVGDLDPGQSFISPALSKTGIHLGLFGGMYRWTPRISFRGSFAYNMIRGNDAVSTDPGDDVYRKVRNLSFVNHMVELKADVIYDLFANKGTYLKRPDYVPYVFTGLAVFYQTPFAQLDNSNGGYQNLRTYNKGNNSEGISVSPIQLAIPLGLGFRKKMNKEWDFAFEIGWRVTFTDYLDDVSGNYAALSDDREIRKWQTKSYGADVVAYAASHGLGTHLDPILGQQVVNGFGDNSQGPDKRGTANQNDWYVVTNLSLTKVLKGGVRCPKFR